MSHQSLIYLINLSQCEQAVLSKGLKFNHTDANKSEFVAAFEAGLKSSNLNEDVQTQLRTKVCQQLQNQNRHNLTKEEQKSLVSLRKNDKIVILPTDKGNGIAVMNKEDYRNKINELLLDEETYELTKKDPTKTFRQKIYKKILSLQKKSLITKEQGNYIRPTEGPVPRLYGLPKVHKQGNPLRPIVSSISSPTYQLAKFLTKTLRPCLPKSDGDVNNSTDFVQRIKNIQLMDDEVMVSFDITSLFTNIPMQLALESLERMIVNDETLNGRTKIQPKDLMELVNFCSTTYLQYDKRIYRQKRGTPMGSPISGLLADAVMKHFESIAFERYKPKLWIRYVDDTFVILPMDMIDDFETQLNGLVPGLAFTKESEKDNCLPFLDVLVSRKPDGLLETSVYRKPTTTDVILKFDSNHPKQHLKSCVRTLFQRVRTHCSTNELKQQERQALYKLFTANGYPKAFINASLRTHTPPKREPILNKRRITIPYIQGASEATERIFKPFGIQVAHKPNKTLRSTLVRIKDPVEPLEQSGVVYAIPCLQCDQQYVGETGKQLATRLHEHKLALRRADPKSQIWNHCAETGHEVDIDRAKIVARARAKGERLVLEALFSNQSFNRHVDIDTHYPIIVGTQSERAGNRQPSEQD